MIAEAFNCEVQWDKENQKAIIIEKNNVRREIQINLGTFYRWHTILEFKLGRKGCWNSHLKTPEKSPKEELLSFFETDAITKGFYVTR